MIAEPPEAVRVAERLLEAISATIELDGRPPLTVKAGEALVEPPKVPMTGYNRSATEPTKVVIFYVSANDTPFLDMMSH